MLTRYWERLLMNKVYTVSEINSYIKKLFDADYVLDNISIEGEVSNYKRHSSGHLYFTLKDKEASLAVVMFAGNTKSLSFELQNGMRIEAKGRISVYERDGRYQLYARELSNAGFGKLYIEFERLKKELYELGMFDAGYKKEIPKFANKVGIVTSDTGAAIRDIVRVSRMRNPYVQLYLCPALVQGEGAAKSIANAISVLDEMNLDVLIVGRGGGSIEDLWAFNEETVARAIFSCNTPVISAVGHETDFTISDFVADLREATPSSAAARAVFDYSAFSNTLNISKSRLHHNMLSKLEQYKLKLVSVKEKLNRLSPVISLNNNRLYLDYCYDKLNELMLKKIELNKQRLNKNLISFNNMIGNKMAYVRHHLDMKRNSLRLLSPYEKLKGGYSFVSDMTGKPVKTINDISKGSVLNIDFSDGSVQTEVKSIKWKK